MAEYIERPEHEEMLKRMEDEHDRINKRLNLMEETIRQFGNLTISVERLALNMEHMVEEQKRQGKQIEALEEVPKKNWDALKYGILGAIATAVGGAVVLAITGGM